MEEAHERGARRPAGSFRTLALLLLSAGALVLWRAQPWQAPDELLVDDRRALLREGRLVPGARSRPKKFAPASAKVRARKSSLLQVNLFCF